MQQKQDQLRSLVKEVRRERRIEVGRSTQQNGDDLGFEGQRFECLLYSKESLHDLAWADVLNNENFLDSMIGYAQRELMVHGIRHEREALELRSQSVWA